MTYKRFEDLPAWQTAAELYEAVENLLNEPSLKLTSGFRDQLDRAALSVSNNIAEGFERGTTKELLQYLYIARGSAGEVRSMLIVKLRTLKGPQFRSRISDVIALGESCSRQLRAWADSLQNSEIKGPRHLNQKSREQDDQKKRAVLLQKRLLQNLPVTHPMRQDAERRGLL